MALLTDMVKQTIICVKCCADPFRLFGRIFYCVLLISVFLFIHLFCATIYDGEIKLYVRIF